MNRREFSVAQQVAIVNRASDSSWHIHCEICGIWLKSRADYEIDHVRPEAMQPIGAPLRKLTAADGQVACLRCHAEKTGRDRGDIAEASRREAYRLGVSKKRQRKKRERRPLMRQAAGKSEIARRYQ